MEEGTANPKPSLQQSVRANAAAEPGLGHIINYRNYAIDDLTNLPSPFAENGLASHVDYGIYGSALDPLATSGNHTYANPWITAHPQNDAFAPLVDPSPSQLVENIFPAGAAYNAGTAFPNGPGHYSWAPAVATGPMDQDANTNFQYLYPSFSVTCPYAAGIIGNVHGGQLQTIGFNTQATAAGGFANASFAVDSGNSFGSQYAANGDGTQMSAAGAFPDVSYAVNNGNSYGGFPTQLMAPDAKPSGFRAIDSGNIYGGQFRPNGVDTPVMVPEAYPSALRAVDSGNVHEGQLPANSFDTPLMARDAYPSAFRGIDSSHVHAGQFPACGCQNQPNTAVELPNAPPAVDDNATPLGAAHVAPARHTCPECKTPFKRKGELKRHAKKHQAGSNVFRCVVAGCVYSSYRKDKLANHVKKHRHAVTASAST